MHGQQYIKKNIHTLRITEQEYGYACQIREYM